jgi:hypothetical protein
MSSGDRCIPSYKVTLGNTILTQTNLHTNRIDQKPQTPQYVGEQEAVLQTVAAPAPVINHDLPEQMLRVKVDLSIHRVVQHQVLVGDLGDGMDVQRRQERQVWPRVVLQAELARYVDVSQVLRQLLP